MRSMVALTGTPGTGKSSVAAHLSTRWKVVEVGDLALRQGCARPVPGGLSVDLPELAGRLRRGRRPADILVGHLAHLLPVEGVVVLRCHPEELVRRLARARRGSVADREENYGAEALDIVLVEALRTGRRVWEVDTTGRSAEEVARAVRRRLERRGRSSYGRVRWLTDPRVTEHLLARGP